MSSVTLAALIITDALCPYKWQEVCRICFSLMEFYYFQLDK